MKANELRIGSWIQEPYDNIAEQVYDIVTGDDVGAGQSSSINGEDGDYFKPIPLTEEWLLKFGFKYCKEWGSYINNGYMVEKISDLFCDRKYGVVIKYVHQLQNFNFIVKNKELELK